MKTNFFDAFHYIDGITVVDCEGRIQYSVKYNPAFNQKSIVNEEIIGKRLDDVFPNIDRDNSTLYASMDRKKLSRRKNSTSSMHPIKKSKLPMSHSRLLLMTKWLVLLNFPGISQIE